MNRFYILKQTVFIVFILSACSSVEKIKLVLYQFADKPEIFFESSCKIPSFNLKSDESSLQALINQSTAETISRLKLKSSGQLSNSDYTITKNQLNITESCAISLKNNSAFFRIRQLIELENIKSKERIQFFADTIPIQNKELNQPRALVPQKPDFTKYIPALTQKNFMQVKAFLIQQNHPKK